MRMKEREWHEYRLKLLLSRQYVAECPKKCPDLDICCEQHYVVRNLNEMSIEMPGILDAFSFAKEWVLFAQDKNFRKVLRDWKVPHTALIWEPLRRFVKESAEHRYYIACSKPFVRGNADVWQLQLNIDGPASELLSGY